MAVLQEVDSQSALGLLPEIKTEPSASRVALEWYILGIVEAAA